VFRDRLDEPVRKALALQGSYYAATGIWSVVHRRSFEAVTGEKVDYWLVRMVGLLASVIGATLAASALREERPPAPALGLAAGAGAAFSCVDVVYAARGRIRPVYLADAALHAGLAAWLVAARDAPRRAPSRFPC
jgi:hypothetical protein